MKKILKQDLSTDETMQAHEFSVTLSYLQDLSTDETMQAHEFSVTLSYLQD